MAKKRKVRIDRIIILVLAFILVFGAFGFGLYKLFGMFFDENKTQEQKIPKVVVTTDGIKLSLGDYTVYTDDTGDLGFNFVIANIIFEANEGINFELSNLQTSEKINLGDVSKYLKKMELASYDLNKLGINTTGITSSENKTEAKLFIPYNTNASSLSVYNSIDASKIEFNLEKNVLVATALKLDDNKTQIEVGTNKVGITNAYISDFMLHNGEQYQIGSSTKIYTFEITVIEALENTVITDAVFIEKGTSEEIKCKSSEYRAIDMNNIIDKELAIGIKGGLFFEIYTNDSYVHDGTLLIKFSNSDALVEISFESDN